jgi:hypothetical protein
MKYDGYSLGPIVRALVALAAVGCHSTSVEVVRSRASSDFPCAEGKIQVKPTKDKGTFHAEGCGKSGTYTCEGWDSYNQAPICAPAR